MDIHPYITEPPDSELAMKDGYCENCPNPIDCYQTGRCWPPSEPTNADMKEDSNSSSTMPICPHCKTHDFISFDAAKHIHTCSKCGTRWSWNYLCGWNDGFNKADSLKEWSAKQRAECVLKHVKSGMEVIYGGQKYLVARIERGMIVIYDEPPSLHVDYINPRNVTLPPGRYASDEDGQAHPASLTEIVVNGMIARLRRVADEMEECGEALQLLENYVPAAGSFQRGAEMKGAVDMARQWAAEIRLLNACRVATADGNQSNE